MNTIRYLAVFCIVLVLSAASVRSVRQFFPQLFEGSQQAQVIKTFPQNFKTVVTEVPQNVLIDDHENPIVPAVVSVPSVPRPYITAESYLVANLETGEKYIDVNSGRVFPIASVSKLYTALVVHHLFDLKGEIEITQPMLDAYGDAGELKLGEKFTAEELLSALLLVSSNDAAEGFAYSYGYQNFMDEMNGFAKEIGMHNTYFRDSSGLSSGNVSTANDLLVLSQYLHSSEEDILATSRTPQATLASTTNHLSHVFTNINPFAYNPEFIGGKTGRTTAAKEAMVSLFNKKVGDKEYPIVIIVLRSEFGERELDTQKLLRMFTEKVENL